MLNESKVYLNFFNSHRLILIIFILGLGTLGFIYQAQKPPGYLITAALEIDYDQANIEKKTLLTDEAVATLRSKQLQQQLGMNPATKTVVVKMSGPLLINIQVKSPTQNQALIDLEKIIHYAVGRYDFKEIGSKTIQPVKASATAVSLIGALFGLGIGLIIVLIQTYLTLF